jgi:hypothetical protein
MQQIKAAYENAGYKLIESLDEGDHSHFAFASGPSHNGAGHRNVVLCRADWIVQSACTGEGLSYDITANGVM